MTLSVIFSFFSHPLPFIQMVASSKFFYWIKSSNPLRPAEKRAAPSIPGSQWQNARLLLIFFLRGLMVLNEDSTYFFFSLSIRLRDANKRLLFFFKHLFYVTNYGTVQYSEQDTTEKWSEKQILDIFRMPRYYTRPYLIFVIFGTPPYFLGL